MATPAVVFTATNGVELTRGGYLHEGSRDASLADQVEARRQARAADIDLSMTAQAENAFQAPPPLALVRHVLGDLSKPRHAHRGFVIEKLVPRRVVTLGSGHGGTGKSIILGLILGAHVANGSDVFGLRVEQGRVLFVSLEDEPDMVELRLQRVVRAYGLDPERVAQNFEIVAPPEGGDPVLATEVGEFGGRRMAPTATFEEMAERAKGVSFIIADNASDAYDSNENDRSKVRAFIRMLGRVAAANDAGFILLAHIDKNSAKFGGAGNTFSGSTAWHNSTRSRLVLTETAGAVKLSQEKLNFGKKLDEVAVLAWSDQDDTFRPTSAKDQEPITNGGHADAVLKAMRLSWQQKEDVRVARSGPMTTQRHLETLGLVQDLRGSRGRDAFWAAVGGLVDAGRLVTVAGRTASRNACQLFIEPGDRCARIPHTPDVGTHEPTQAHSYVPVSVSSRVPMQTHATHAEDAYRSASSGE